MEGDAKIHRLRARQTGLDAEEEGRLRARPLPRGSARPRHATQRAAGMRWTNGRETMRQT